MEEKRLFCMFCGKQFTKPGGRGVHEKRCELNPNKFISEIYLCKYCNKECVGKDGLSNHEKHCYNNPNRCDRKTDTVKCECTCKYCGAVFANFGLLRQHNRVCEERLKLPLDTLGRVINYEGIKKSHSIVHKKYVNGESEGSFTGRHHSDETKQKISESTKQYLLHSNNIGGARYSVKACKYIDQLNAKNNWNLQHGMNGGEITVGPYYLDGYDSELNIAFEYDESNHYDYYGNLSQHDIEKQEYIKNQLNCTFYRYNEAEDLLYIV